MKAARRERQRVKGGAAGRGGARGGRGVGEVARGRERVGGERRRAAAGERRDEDSGEGPKIRRRPVKRTTSSSRARRIPGSTSSADCYTSPLPSDYSRARLPSLLLPHELPELLVAALEGFDVDDSPHLPLALELVERARPRSPRPAPPPRTAPPRPRTPAGTGAKGPPPGTRGARFEFSRRTRHERSAVSVPDPHSPPRRRRRRRGRRRREIVLVGVARDRGLVVVGEDVDAAALELALPEPAPRADLDDRGVFGDDVQGSVGSSHASVSAHERVALALGVRAAPRQGARLRADARSARREPEPGRARARRGRGPRFAPRRPPRRARRRSWGRRSRRRRQLPLASATLADRALQRGVREGGVGVGGVRARRPDRGERRGGTRGRAERRAAEHPSRTATGWGRGGGGGDERAAGGPARARGRQPPRGHQSTDSSVSALNETTRQLLRYKLCEIRPNRRISPARAALGAGGSGARGRVPPRRADHPPHPAPRVRARALPPSRARSPPPAGSCASVWVPVSRFPVARVPPDPSPPWRRGVQPRVASEARREGVRPPPVQAPRVFPHARGVQGAPPELLRQGGQRRVHVRARGADAPQAEPQGPLQAAPPKLLASVEDDVARARYLRAVRARVARANARKNHASPARARFDPAGASRANAGFVPGARTASLDALPPAPSPTPARWPSADSTRRTNTPGRDASPIISRRTTTTTRFFTIIIIVAAPGGALAIRPAPPSLRF